MPEIQFADLKSIKKGNEGAFSSFLLEQEETLKAINKLFYFESKRICSKACAHRVWVPMCKKCDVSMTLHKYQLHHEMPLLRLTLKKLKNASCGSHDIKQWVWVHEIEEEITNHFGNQYSVKRMDWDTTRKKSSFQLIIDQFEQKEIDILIGTQMVSKGLDFEHGFWLVS